MYIQHEIHGNKSRALKRASSLRSLNTYHKTTHYVSHCGLQESYISDISFNSSGYTFAASTLEGQIYFQTITKFLNDDELDNSRFHLGSTRGDILGGKIDVGHRIESCRWNPEPNSNEFACCFSSYRDILIFDLGVSQTKPICSLQGSDHKRANGGGILDLAGGTGIIGGGRDGVIRIWDFRAGNRDVMSKNKTGTKGAVQAVCTISPDGSTVATGTEEGQLTMHDLRYFGPSLQDVFLPNVVPLSPAETKPITTYQPSYGQKNNDHAIHALSVGQCGMEMGHVLAFQLRGSCRVGLYNILSHNIHMIDNDPSVASYHKLTRGRIAFSHLDSTLFYGDTSNSLQAVDCGGCMFKGQSTRHQSHAINMESMVTSMATNALGVVAVGLESSDVVLCNNSVTNWKQEVKDDIIDCTE